MSQEFVIRSLITLSKRLDALCESILSLMQGNTIYINVFNLSIEPYEFSLDNLEIFVEKTKGSLHETLLKNYHSDVISKSTELILSVEKLKLSKAWIEEVLSVLNKYSPYKEDNPTKMKNDKGEVIETNKPLNFSEKLSYDKKLNIIKNLIFKYITELETLSFFPFRSEDFNTKVNSNYKVSIIQQSETRRQQAVIRLIEAKMHIDNEINKVTV